MTDADIIGGRNTSACAEKTWAQGDLVNMPEKHLRLRGENRIYRITKNGI